jgi:hypothetical protein
MEAGLLEGGTGFEAAGAGVIAAVPAGVELGVEGMGVSLADAPDCGVAGSGSSAAVAVPSTFL